MKKLFVLIVGFSFLLNSFYALAQKEEDLKFTHGPYLQNVSESAATIIFTTNKLVVPGVIISSANEPERMIQNTTDGLVNVGNNLHKIRIENLQPGKVYNYRLYAKEIEVFQPYKVVFGSEITSDSYSFKTFNPKKENIKFMVFCDIHDDAEKLGKYLESNNISEQDCYFLNGDILGHIENEEQIFESFIDTCVSRFASEKPFLYARGNHETRGKFARQLKSYIDLPNNRYYYAQTMGNTRFIVLDGGEDKPDTTSVYAGLADFDNYRLTQLEWLKKETESKAFRAAQFKIVIIHMPIIQNKKNWYGMEFLAKHYGPVLKKAKIDLMISGHTHHNAWISSRKSGFGYPVMISSNNNYIEAGVNKKAISIHLKNKEGEIVDEHLIEK